MSPHGGQVRAWNLTDWGDMFDVDRPLDEARPEQFDALLLPGGVGNPDLLRTNGGGGSRAFFDAGKPVASICHGPWTLIEAGGREGPADDHLAVAADRPAERRGDGEDEAAVMDRNLVTSRGPQDIPAFNRR